MASVRSTFRSTGVAIRLTLLSTVVLGVAYPLAVWGVGQAAFHDQANGSMVTDSSGKVVGSSLIGQSFDGKDADRWFQSRPSAAGEKGYDANASSGSNLGPSNPDLTKAVEERRAALAKADGVSAADVPADAVTASGSGSTPTSARSTRSSRCPGWPRPAGCPPTPSGSSSTSTPSPGSSGSSVSRSSTCSS